MRSLVCALLISSICSAQLDSAVNALAAGKDLKHGVLAVCVMRASDGKMLFSFNGEKSVVPASTLKIFTTGAALGILGASYRFETRLAGTVPLSAEGILNGDLLIIGGGDPTLQSEHVGEQDVVGNWARQLKKAGLRKITGNIIAVASAWERTVPDHWIWADISNYFGAVPCALSYRDNKCRITFSSGNTGTEARIEKITPRYLTKKMSYASKVTSEGKEDRAFVYGNPFSFEKEIRGTIPAGRAHFSIEAVLPDPALLCAEELKEALVKEGIKCSGKTMSDYERQASSGTTIYSHLSPPLSDIVEITNQRSNNHYCESLVLLLGEGHRQRGLEAITNYWQKRGVDVSGIFLCDGSGLSRAGLCTARSQCEVLQKMTSDSASWKFFDRSLPRAGKQGSMSLVGKGTILENRLRAKTGYIERVRAYCGYVPAPDGQLLAFSVIMNNFSCSPTRARQLAQDIMIQIATDRALLHN